LRYSAFSMEPLISINTYKSMPNNSMQRTALRTAPIFTPGVPLGYHLDTTTILTHRADA